MSSEMNGNANANADSAREIAQTWLAEFEAALKSGDVDAVVGLFAEDGSWRDMVAFTWHIRSFWDPEQIAAALNEHLERVAPHDFELDLRSEPEFCPRGIREPLEAYFTFSTSVGRGNGIFRLLADEEGAYKAWTVMTALKEIAGHEPKQGPTRPRVSEFCEDFGGKPWSQKRADVLSYKDSDPTVLIVGAGQAGLSLAARLRAVGIDTLVVDKHERVGDNWRKRYESLKLHTETPVNHFPFMPFPETSANFQTKDQFGDWLETYARTMEIKVWNETELVSARYDEEEERWTARLRTAEDGNRTLHPRHLVIATGLSDIPNLPAIEGLDDFRGEAMHSSEFQSGGAYEGKSAIVFGAGNSGLDIAHDLAKHGASVTLVQRGPMTIIDLDPTALQQFGFFSSGLPTEICDLLMHSNPYPALIEINIAVAKFFAEADKEMLQGLADAGFKTHFGADGTGHFIQYQRSGGGYYLNTGGAELIISGDIAVKQFDEIDRFTRDGVALREGGDIAVDLAVFATGWKPPGVTLERLFGPEITERVGKIWGYDEGGELNNMYKRTEQPGLWFLAGGIPEARTYSLYTALQIQACELGLIPVRLPFPAASSVEPIVA